MTRIRLGNAISDCDVWKRAFDNDPVRREQSGVRRYRVFRPADDPTRSEAPVASSGTR